MSNPVTAAEIAALREQASHPAVALPLWSFRDTYDQHGRHMLLDRKDRYLASHCTTAVSSGGGRIVAPVADYIATACNLAPRLADRCDRQAAELERLRAQHNKLRDMLLATMDNCSCNELNPPCTNCVRVDDLLTEVPHEYAELEKPR